MQANLSQSIEAILFATAEPQTYAFLAQTLAVETEAVAEAVEALKVHYAGRGITVLALNDTVALGTGGEYSSLIETIRKEQLSKELTKASAETLAIVAYAPGISKSQIEFIRGVNASYSLRALLMRGLIESKGQGRAVGYYPTIELLQHFGITDLTQLPEYASTKAKLDALLAGSDQSTS